MPAPAPYDVTPHHLTPPGALPPNYRTGPAITKPPLHTSLRTFTSRARRTFAVRVLPANARYGRDGSRVSDVAIVEFYDTTYADDTRHDETTGFGPLGQFVNRYAFGEIIQHQGTLHLRTHDEAAQEAWAIDAATMKEITHWLADPHTVTCTVTKTHQIPKPETEDKDGAVPEEETSRPVTNREAS